MPTSQAPRAEYKAETSPFEAISYSHVIHKLYTHFSFRESVSQLALSEL